MKRNGASPGGPMVSAAKRIRLEALNDAFLRHLHSKPDEPSRPQAQRARAQQQPPMAGNTEPNSQPGEFPYGSLGDALLDGSLSAALARAKSASLAAAAAMHAWSAAGATTNPFRGAAARDSTAKGARGFIAQAAAAAAAAAAAGGDTVAAELLVQLVATNPRASSSDLRNLVTQRLQDKSILLENPTAPVKMNKLFARRGSNYSAKLQSSTRRKAREAQKEPTRNTPSYQTMLRVHQLWLQYAQDVARGGAAGAAGGGNGGRGAAAGGRGEGSGGGFVDLHGAMVTVVRHSNPQLVGAAGIVLRRSGASLHLVTPEDRIRVVPLKGGTVQYTVNGKVLQLCK